METELIPKPGEIPIPDGLCLLAYRGSIAHNMYVPPGDPDSIDDVDLMGIAVAPREHYLGLQSWGSRGTMETKEGRYDCVFYEIRKAFGLLLQGNPNILSLLWLRPEHYLMYYPPLIDNRQLFVGKHAYNSFAAYASAQLQKMETREPAELLEYMRITAELKRRGKHPTDQCTAGLDRYLMPQLYSQFSDQKLLQRLRHYQKKGENIGYLGEKRKQLVLEHGYDSKNAAHCIRLLRMAKEFLLTGEMTVFRPDAEELLKIKRGEWRLGKVKTHAEELFAQVKEAKEKSPLREEPDRKGAQQLLVRILHEAICPPGGQGEKR